MQGTYVCGLKYMRSQVCEHDLCALASYQQGKTLGTMRCLLTVGGSGAEQGKSISSLREAPDQHQRPKASALHPHPQSRVSRAEAASSA